MIPCSGCPPWPPDQTSDPAEDRLSYTTPRDTTEGVFREMKARTAYEKPSERKVREKAEAVRRARKQARKQAIREGLIAAPKRPERPQQGRPGMSAPRPVQPKT